jgi:hypothetical protein
LSRINLNFGRGVAAVFFDASFDFFKLFISDGSFVSSAANLHSDSEVFPPDFVIRAFTRTRRPECKRHDGFTPSLKMASMRAMSAGWRILSRPTGVNRGVPFASQGLERSHSLSHLADLCSSAAASSKVRDFVIEDEFHVIGLEIHLGGGERLPYPRGWPFN